MSELRALPLPSINSKDSKEGVYEIELSRDWFKKARPYLKLLTGTLGLILPVASSAVKLALDENAYKAIEEQLDFGKNVITATLGEGEKIGEFMDATDTTTLEHGEAIRAHGATLRELHALLKAGDSQSTGQAGVQARRPCCASTPARPLGSRGLVTLRLDKKIVQILPLEILHGLCFGLSETPTEPTDGVALAKVGLSRRSRRLQQPSHGARDASRVFRSQDNVK